MKNIDFDAVRALRAGEPAAIAAALARRVRRPVLAGDNRLFILAADHPGRGALGVGGDEMAMADRYDLLSRLAEVMTNPDVDGFLGTPDLVEDLALLGALDGKIVVGSMNRGGIKSARFEMDDRFTAFSIESMIDGGIDFGKLLLRINLDDAGSIDTIASAADAISAAAAAKLPVMIEPFMCSWLDGAIENDLSTEAVIKSVAIASALGSSSAYTWLKLPVVADMERVMQATTLPTLLLGGDPARHDYDVYSRWKSGLALPGVRGLVVGRSLLYPPDDDFMGAVERAARLVH
jgi:hypothetical protein